MWHRYAPDPTTGWTERWIELRGATPTALFQKGALGPTRTVLPAARARDLERLMDAIESRVAASTAGFDPEAAALGLQVLALVIEKPRERIPERPITGLVERAEKPAP